MVEVAVPPVPGPEPEPIRAHELERLKSALAAEQGAVYLLTGPRSVGKGLLAGDLVKAARAQGLTAVFEGKTPGPGAGSFHPFAEIARQAMSWAEQSGAAEALLDPVLPDLEAVLGADAPSEPAAFSLDQKLRFFEGVRRLLSGIAERTRLLTVVHDLERADADTLELAAHLADNLFGDAALEPGNGRPGVLLLLLRDDRTTAERARDFLAEAEARKSMHVVRLEGLDLEGIRRYVQSPRVLERLMAASEGLPREIDAIIDSLPSNVEELFQRRLDAMDPIGREVLHALALSGQPEPARALAQVTGRPVTAVARALSELKERRIVERRIRDGELEFGFVRRSNLEVTVRAMSTEDRARLHGGWAQALTGGNAALLAHHQLRSAEPARGVPTAIKAAESHAVAGAFDAAVQLLEEALAHARADLRVVILGRLSELSALLGQPRAAVRYVEQWKAALPPSERGRALLREAELRNAAGEHERALQLLDEAGAEQNLDGASADAAASEALYQLGRLEEARNRGRRGLSLLADAPASARIGLLNLLGKIALAEDDADLALTHFSETQALAEKAGLAREQARALVNLGLAHMRKGALDAAEQNLLAGADKAREHKDLGFLAFGNLNLGVLAHQRGELGLAIERYRATKLLFRQLGNRTQLARVLYNLGALYLLAGDLARARAHNVEARRLAKAGGVERLVAITAALDGVILGEEGDRLAAESRLREAMVELRGIGPERPLETMVELADLMLRSGDAAGAAQTIAEVEHGLARVPNKQLGLRAKLLRGRAMLVARDAGALGVLTEARDEAQALGERLLLRDAEVALGLACFASGRRETARMHLGAAIEIQQSVAKGLPDDLRATFLAARPQQEALQAIERLSTASQPAEPALAETTRPVQRRATPSVPPPAERRPEWASRYAAIVGASPKLSRVFKILDRVATSDNTVLICGESGTGKELIAEAIHVNSSRAKGPFVKLNCAALVESLLLSELFGHERGSFTGAHQRKVGRFEMAAGGTIFLDEIGDISPKTQVSLLRVLQEREFERVGGGKPIKLEARVICATNRNLPQMVREGTFREDLYYRLKGLTIELPPLRERTEDIAQLAQSFLARYGLETGTPEKKLSRAALDMLERYSWPGNIRELENVIRSVALFADAPVIDLVDFDEYRDLFEDSPSFAKAISEPVTAAVVMPSMPPPPVASIPAPAPSLPAMPSLPPPPPIHAVPPDGADDGDQTIDAEDDALLNQIFQRGIPLSVLKRRIQDEAIAQALRSTRGNITRAAEMLGMKRPRLSQIINASEALKALCQEVGR